MNARVEIDQNIEATKVELDIPAYDVRSLTRTHGQANLVLDGAVYHLRITRAGKLILTK
ncbi:MULTISPECIES: hemin uptake protein HemP [Halocynthiibacter]|uniref:Hemin uptake protein HemP n=1 Tax=Halocynthiibacter halioticoli TaxID=2986804 RepID=A0AAE3J0Y8_9RHOB|nr:MULTISPECIES: hemin uptake protein HemP [Halocynthiibacter]MCV6825349.1 hemin uptake protein HemP [Halocynthiibacter halioticoli]MCW4058350.1 hemin uptake protein HemP [Halocynthiibacter sp. SDUM655004]MDE0588629.1 hemin uptake protein HemP [Halocynthiibacter sp. C4]